MPIYLPLPQVTRIPITGPAPYNTLVCVQATTNGGPQTVKRGKTSRWPLSVTTTFRLAGFDQRVVPVFDHSTTAFISSIGPAYDDTWLFAVDAVTGAGFDQVDGAYFVNLDLALMPPKSADSECITYGDPTQGGFIVCDVLWTVQVVSYVLCYEPPPADPPQGGHRQRFSPVLVNKVPLRVASTLVERAAMQAERPFALNPKPEPGSDGGCNCAK